jgi:Na+/proline symporter
MSDAATLKAMRISVLGFTVCVLTYAITMQGTSIYEMVSGAYQVPLVGAFVPLVMGLYWKRATTQGAVASVVLGLGTWLTFLAVPALSEAFPQQLAGLIAALVGMLAGSLAPQWVVDRAGHVHHFEGSAT